MKDVKKDVFYDIKGGTHELQRASQTNETSRMAFRAQRQGQPQGVAASGPTESDNNTGSRQQRDQSGTASGNKETSGNKIKQ